MVIGLKEESVKNRKKIKDELIDKKVDAGRELYELLHRLVADHHPHLLEASIALAWHDGWSRDQDGRLTLGRARKVSDLDYQLMEYDFVIQLNRDVWAGDILSDAQKEAIVDHELCHCDLKIGDDGEPARDELGRIVWRIRKHDIEEFAAVVERHGLWKRDVEQFVRAALRNRREPLFRDLGEALQSLDGKVMVGGDGSTATISYIGERQGKS